MAYLPDRVRRSLEHLEEGARAGATLPLPIVYERVERTRWEYKLLSLDLREEAPLGEEQLQPLGAEGWLLAGIVEEPSASGGVRRITYYFVRAAEDEA